MSRKIIIVLKIYFHVCDSIQQLLKGSTTIQNFPVAYQKRLYLNVIEGNMKLRSIRLSYFCTFSFHLNSTLIPKTVITNINSCPCRIKNIVSISWDQKQPSRGVLGKRCSENMQQIYRRTPMPKYDFNKVAKQSNFIEITFRHGCSPVNLLHIFRYLFLETPLDCCFCEMLA